MEWLKLIGVVIIVIGFAIRLNTIGVVLIAGIATGLVAGLSFNEIMNVLGTAFVTNRYMTIFVLTLPVIGILEKYGLKERAFILVSKMKTLTAGRLLAFYLVFRVALAGFGLRIGGHAKFVRPLVLPMSKGAAERDNHKLNDKENEDLKGTAAAMENFGNFFGQNLFPAAGGVLLIAGTLESLGYPVDVIDIAKYSAIMGGLACIAGGVQCFFLDKEFNKNKKD